MNRLTILFLFISCIFSQFHFNVDINGTGESTLVILESSISNLQIGDEIGIFDNDGIINDSGDTGEILVGSGVWNGNQLNLVAIHSVDLSQFGGPILPGAVEGNEIILKIWNSATDTEYSVSYILSSGTNTYSGLFSAINSIDCLDAVIDECGICNGPGEIYECGCYDIIDGTCDCEGNILDCSGECGGAAVIDECGECGGDGIDEGACDCNGNIEDCAGECGGAAVVDECGECGGDGIDEGACDCNGNIEDCAGECGGDALVDNCGVCIGDSSTCEDPQAVLSFYDMGGSILLNITYDNLISDVCFENVILSSTGGATLDVAVGNCINLDLNNGVLPIYFKNHQSIGGFQFNLTGLNILDVSGGAAEDAGFTISHSNSMVIGFSFSGSSLNPTGEFSGCLDYNACNYNPWATIDSGSCEYPNENYDCDGNCLDLDCNDECGGSAVLDDCGICNGPGAVFECEDGSFVCDEFDCEDGGGGDGGGGGGNNECADDEIEDCWGNCAPSSWLGDGYCDESMADFNCFALAYDMGDCPIDFTSHIMPIINANCTGYCHSGASAYDGGLNLESYSNLMVGGNSGPAVVPYYPDYSLLIQKLEGTAPGSQMPYGSDPLPENYIQTIFYWIEQGAIEPEDNDDGIGGGCEDGLIEDCNGQCFSQIFLGDGNCDDGEIGEADFNCIEYIFDNTDCPIGNLDFGEYTYNINNNNGTIEVHMNCEFAVSNFEIEISGLNISGLFGGATEDANFNLTYANLNSEGLESIILGSSENQNIPPNSGLLTIINYSSIWGDEVCFTNSTITTYNDITYEAILGDCIDATLLDVNIENPLNFSISNIYPNPFNPEAKVFYDISKGDNIQISIYDILGRVVKDLKNSYHHPGSYELILNASGIPSGIYFIKINSSQFSDSKKFTIAK